MFNVVQEERRFSLDEGIRLPQDMIHRIVDGKYHAFISVDKAAYIVTSHTGARFVEFFHQGLTLADAIDRVCHEFNIPVDVASESLSQLLLQIEKNGFYRDSTVTEDTHTDFPLLCYLTKQCNLACTHCYVSASPFISTETDMTTRQWFSVFSDYEEFTSNRHLNTKITFTGGEPMIRNDFFELAGFAKGLGIVVELFTNGTLLQSAETVNRLAACVDLVQISLDGATESINDSIRGKGTYKRILRAMRLLAQSPIKWRVAITLMPANYQDLDENLTGLMSRFGDAKFEVRIGLANIQGRADPSVRFTDSAEAERALRHVLSKLYESGLRHPRNITPNFRGLSCGYGRSMNISSDGRVYGCAIEAYLIGNLQTERFNDVALRVLQLAEATSINNIHGCNTCELRYFCYGLCRLNNFFKNRSLFVSCCTPEKKQEVLKKLVHRQLAEDRPLVESARVGSFWLNL